MTQDRISRTELPAERARFFFADFAAPRVFWHARLCGAHARTPRTRPTRNSVCR